MRKACTSLAAFALIALLTGCAAMTGERTDRTFNEDAAITAAVRKNLALERFSTLTGVDVHTTDRTVYLSGSVSDDFARERATILASSVDGVTRVVNNVKPAAAGDAPVGAYGSPD